MVLMLLGVFLTCVCAYGYESVSSFPSSPSSPSSEGDDASWTLTDANGLDLCTDTYCTAFYEDVVRFQALWSFEGEATDPAFVFSDKDDLLFPDDVPFYLCPKDDEDVVWPGQFKLAKKCANLLPGDSYNFTTPGLSFHFRSLDDFQDGRYSGDLSLTFKYQTDDGEGGEVVWPTKTVTLLLTTGKYKE